MPREAGYTKVDAYTPFPIEEVWEALGHHKSRLPLIVLVAVFSAASSASASSTGRR